MLGKVRATAFFVDRTSFTGELQALVGNRAYFLCFVAFAGFADGFTFHSHVAANRNWELYQRLKEEFEPIEMPHAVIDTEKPIEHSVAEALAFLRLQA